MAFTRTLGTTLKEGSQTLDAGTLIPAVTGDTKGDFDQAIAGTTANQHFVFAIRSTAGKLKQLYITSDIALTIYTNHASGSSPDNTLALVANVAVQYQASAGMTNPFATADVTDLYITPGGAVAGRLKIFTLQDPT